MRTTDSSFKSPHFTLHPLGEHACAAIASIGGSAISNAGLVDLGGQVVAFDAFLTPQAAADLRRASVELFGRPPDVAVLSHNHNDHIWGCQAYAPAQIISSECTRQCIAAGSAEELAWYKANSAAQLADYQAQHRQAQGAERERLELWLGYYAGLVEALPQLKVALPGVTFADRLTLHGSRASAELIACEGGHSRSDTVLYLPEERVLFMGDLLFNRCHPYLADGDPQRLLEALDELPELGAQSYVPGHGPLGGRAGLDALAGYVRSCQDTAREMTRSGAVSDEAAAAQPVPAEYGPWELPQFYAANLKFLCSKAERGPA